MELDIEKILKNEGPCRPCEIRKKLKEKPEYKSYAQDEGRTLDVLIQRALIKLGDRVHREYRGRQRVFYSLRKEARAKVEEEALISMTRFLIFPRKIYIKQEFIKK